MGMVAHRWTSSVEGRGRRERTKHVVLALIGCLILAASLVIAIQQVFVPTAVDTAAAQRDAKADQFEQTRAAQIRRPVTEETCREVLFDNDSGRFTGGNKVACETLPDETQRKIGTSGRINAIRDWFTR